MCAMHMYSPAAEVCALATNVRREQVGGRSQIGFTAEAADASGCWPDSAERSVHGDRVEGGDVRHADNEQVDQVKALINRISPILHGHDRRVQGAVLADLLATWLAGHCVPDNRLQTTLLRGRIFHEHMKIVRDLTKVNAMQIELENIT